MTYICFFCAAEIAQTDNNLCEGCEVVLTTLVPKSMAQEVDQALHEMDENEGVVV